MTSQSQQHSQQQSQSMTITEALSLAERWAREHVEAHSNAAFALAYIDAIDANREEGKRQGRTEEDSDKVQCLYILSNLGTWRGDEAREAKKVIKKFATGK